MVTFVKFSSNITCFNLHITALSQELKAILHKQQRVQYVLH